MSGSHKRKLLIVNHGKDNTDGSEVEMLRKQISVLEETVSSLQKQLRVVEVFSIASNLQTVKEQLDPYQDTLLNIVFHASKQREVERYDHIHLEFSPLIPIHS